MVIEAVPKLAKRNSEEDLPAMTREMALLAEREQRTVVTVERAARLVGKSRDTIYRWLEIGKLSGRKVGGRWIIYEDTLEAEWDAGLVERR